MKTLSEIDLTIAEGDFAVSNTPLYLVRKLRANSAVEEISRSFDGSEILEALKRAAADKPTTLAEAVRPYVYLVALSRKSNVSYLEEARKIPAGNFDWFNYVVDLLIETFTSTSILSFRILEPQTTSNTDTSVSQRTIILEK